MGENEGLVEPGWPVPNGLLHGTGPIMRALDTERWLKAEERTAELIACIQPNQLSEERRNAVADYVQRLIMKCFPCQVCTFGSVPLKTYLPDGDIDLTAFSHDEILKDTWANQVRDMLENEEKNENSEFRVKEVQYIQAEVKIIKCLVENIVVDISFNQVGGLCTLCFLDEVDSLIDQNHLFKRSIILIKAWCYYESRILGAHHGLISTYALETLVLYIFHVFNNSFHGPLEVLYRFLEFFSNFDWDNFCVSLWGPVPISSLPDVTAESPRKDSGELLLSKLFLDACSSVYAVFPGGQENIGQPFVSKHFNIVDPLRVSNNLGRSVSKGNSFRIRSAFSFGAKKLARLLKCPMENVVEEVNQFFLNTWERHGSGHRPDASGADKMKLSTTNSFCEYGTSLNHLGGKRMTEKSTFHEMEADSMPPHGVSDKHAKVSSRMMPERSELSTASHTQSLKSHFKLNHLKDTNQTERDKILPENQVQKDLKADLSIKDIQGRFLFARTRSSPELTEAYIDVSSQARCNTLAETVNSHVLSSRLAASNQMNFGPENLARPTSHSSIEDSPSMRHLPAQQSVGPATVSNSSSNNYNKDFGSEDFSSKSAAHVAHPEDQDLVNMMGSASLQDFNGQVQIPFNLASAHLPFPIPASFLASMGYTQRNLPGFLPANTPFIDPSFANGQFPHGLVSPQITHYFHGMGITSASEDPVDTTRNIGLVEMNSGEIISSDLHEQEDIASENSIPENKIFDVGQPDDRHSELLSNSKYIPPFRPSGAGGATKFYQKYNKERRGLVPENTDSYHSHEIRNTEVYSEERSGSSSFSSAANSNSSRNRTPSESSWDGLPARTKTSKEKRGKKIFSTDFATNHGKGKIMSEHISDQSVNDDQEWGPMLNVETELITSEESERTASLQIPRHHFPDFEVSQTSGPDSILPFSPMLISDSSRQGMNDNSGLVTFYPAGPPIPFLTMLPLYNVPSEMNTSDASTGNFGGDGSFDQSESAVSYRSEGFDQSELRETNVTITTKEQISDILSSDFDSHWQNLQFGRFCQNSRYHGPLVHPSPVMVPPVYIQGQFPYDNHVRPLSTNSNIFSQLMTSYGHCLVPVAPLQSVSRPPPHVYQRYMDDMPRYRSGTGTYLPNHKISVKERQSSGTRRGNHNYDRNDNYADREGHWNVNSRSRNTGRGHNRSQTDRSYTRSGRLAPNEGRADRPWNSYRHESKPSPPMQSGPSVPNSSQDDPQNSVYNVYPLTATNPKGTSNGPPVSRVMMLYPFSHNDTYGSHGEQLEFGSLGPVPFPGINDQSRLNEGSGAGSFEHKLPGTTDHKPSSDLP